jgi:hypothetical protein
MDEKRRKDSGYNVEEFGLGMVRLDGNIAMEVIIAWAIHLNAFEGSSIAGPKGGVRLSPFSYHTTLFDLDIDATANLNAMERRRHFLVDTEDAYDSSQHHWVAALHGRVPLLPTATTALKTMLVQEGMYLSSQRGREVTKEEVIEHSTSTAVKV